MNKVGTVFIVILMMGIGLLGIWYVFMAPKQSIPNQVVETIPPVDVIPTIVEEMPLPTLVGTNWIVSTIADQPIIEGTSIFATFGQDGRVSGNDGCNNFNGSFTVSGNQLTFNPNMISTKMACQPDIDQQAAAFTTSLLATTHYELAGNLLMLYQGDVAGITMIDQGNSLAKTSWNVTAYNNGNQAVVSMIPETVVSMTFGDDGTVSGNSGCNSFTGQYAPSGSNITVSPLASTMMACESPEGAMEQEAAFLAALQSAATWQIRGNELNMRTAEDALAVVAVRSDL